MNWIQSKVHTTQHATMKKATLATVQVSKAVTSLYHQLTQDRTSVQKCFQLWLKWAFQLKSITMKWRLHSMNSVLCSAHCLKQLTICSFTNMPFTMLPTHMAYQQHSCQSQSQAITVQACTFTSHSGWMASHSSLVTAMQTCQKWHSSTLAVSSSTQKH